MQETEKKTGFTAQDICHIAVFTALIAILAQISIPLPGGVPLTLQTFAVPLAGLVLGAKKGTTSTLIYVLLAAAGVPVLAGMKGGLGAVLGMTGGFVLSFPLMALFAGFAAGKTVRDARLWFWLVLGALVNYAVGTAWFMWIAGTDIRGALAACVLPFLPTAVLKIVLSGMAGTLMRGMLGKTGLLYG
ncbi:MAG: biotin transporter BioY [Lachnospiraceae bacterium]|nr:biotin transporter BioY [Lachnospiraceae bacterium]